MSNELDKTKYPSYIVYDNLHHLLRNRKLELVSGMYFVGIGDRKKAEQSNTKMNVWINNDDFMKQILFHNYIIIEAKDSKNKYRRLYPGFHQATETFETKTFIIIIDKSADIKAQELDKILIKLPDIKNDTRKYNMDVILITEELLTIHPIKKINSINFKGSNKSGYINIINQIFTLFIDDIFTRFSISPHRIITQDEEKKLEQFNIIKSKLPKISHKDPISIVIGAVPDDIIEIINFNENSGKEIKYRLVR